MDDRKKSKDRLIRELNDLRARNAELEERCSAAFSRDDGSDGDRETIFQISFVNSDDPMFIISETGIFLHVNKAFLSRVHKEQREIIGKGVWDVCSKERAEFRLAALKEVFDSKAPKEFEIQYEDGMDVRYFDISMKPLIEKDGVISSVMCVSKDITERKLAEQALRENEEKYRLIVENQTDLLVKTDLEGNYLYVSPSYCELFGKSESELLGNSYKPLVHEDDLPEVERAVEILLHPPYTCYYEERALTIHGWRWLGWAARTILGSQGEIIAFIGAGRDITERKLAEERITDWKQRYELVVAASGQVAYDYDIPTGKIIWGESMEQVLGYSLEQISGGIEQWTDMLHPEDAEKTLRSLAQAEQNCAFWDEEYRMRHINGGYVWIRDRGFFLPDSEGKAYRQLGMMENITERKRAETVFQETKEELERFFSLSPDLLCIADMDGNFRRLNLAWETILGYTNEELMKNRFLDYVHPDDLNETAEAIKELSEQKVSGGYTNRYLCKNGTFRWFEWRVQLSGNLMYIAARDITERKRAEEAFRESDHFVRRILDSTPHIIYIYDLVLQRAIYMNKDIGEIFGFDYEQIRSMSGTLLQNVLHSDDLSLLDRDNPRFAVADDEVMEVEYRIKHANGEWHWLRSREMLFSCDPDGMPRQIIGSAEDITGRKESERELRRQKNRYETILSTTKDGFHVCDNAGKVIDVNEALCELLGYTREELCSMSVVNVDGIEDESAYKEHSARIMKKGFERFETRYRRKDGVLLDIDVSINFIRDDSTFIVFSRDITEKKKLEEQFRQAQKMESVGRLAGGVAHDFNNILTAILGNTELSLMSLSPVDPIYGDIVEIRKSAERAANLTRQLLAFSRKQIISPKMLNLNEVILDMDRMFRRIIGEHINFLTLPNPDIHTVSIDPGQIEQVLTNLVVNARDAMPKGGKLTIETANVILDEEYARSHPETAPGEYVMLAVSDTGIGMDSAIMSHLFEPFFTTKPRGSGTGLGLSTCYGIVKQNHGAISVYSEPGYGTTVKVYLPSGMDAAAILPASVETALSLGGKETILVVEDEQTVRNMILRVLKEKGYTVLTARDGSEALQSLATYTGVLNALITDVVMPHIGGKELSKIVLRRNPGTKVLFMSGYTDNSIVHGGVLDPDVEFIQKPFSPLALVRKVRELLDT